MEEYGKSESDDLNATESRQRNDTAPDDKGLLNQSPIGAGCTYVNKASASLVGQVERRLRVKFVCIAYSVKCRMAS